MILIIYVYIYSAKDADWEVVLNRALAMGKETADIRRLISCDGQNVAPGALTPIERHWAIINRMKLYGTGGLNDFAHQFNLPVAQFTHYSDESLKAIDIHKYKGFHPDELNDLMEIYLKEKKDSGGTSQQ